ncbi:MAG: hypothetical protein L6R40_007809 [Gallowayella cf. fulva]|nr:MAG: hypothetical protein L6R40_007809 [Xanthomendoza cf. fulva]
MPKKTDKTKSTERTKTNARQPWLKRVLVPFWVFQSFFMLALIGINAWILATRTRDRSLFLSLTCINMTLIITEMLLFARSRLHPMTYLFSQLVKTTLWMVLFCMSVAGIVRSTEIGILDQSAFVLLTGIIQVTVVTLSFIGTLIYASIIYHRHCRGTPYYRSDLKTNNDGYKGPFSDPEIGTLLHPNPNRDRNSTTAPEFDQDASIGKKQLGELDNDTAIREMCSPGEGEGRGYGGVRELQGDERVFELSAERSLGGGKKGVVAVEG